MGAVAITALAGSILILRRKTWPLLGPLLPFLRGFTFLFWAVASWRIPFLFALMTWRYVWMRDRFTYEPAIWDIVFPLGMCTAPTSSTARWATASSIRSPRCWFMWRLPRGCWRWRGYCGASCRPGALQDENSPSDR